MSNPVLHPVGCRCPGCLPGQYVMQPAPVARQAALRQHRGNPNPSANFGLILFLVVFPALAAVSAAVGAVADHWRGALELAGFIVFLGAVIWLMCKIAPERAPAPVRLENIPAAPAPGCAHVNVVPVDLPTGERVAWLCPGCDTQLGPGFRASELSPDPSWPPVRRPGR